MLSVKKFTESLRLPARASLCYVFISVVTKAMGFLITPIFTRTLSEEEYGAFTLYISVLGAISILVSAITGGSTVYVGLGKFGKNVGDYYRSLICCAFSFSTAICILLFAFSPILKLNFIFCLLIFLQISFDSISGIYLSALRFSYVYKRVAAICIFEAVASPLIAIGLMSFGVNGAFSRILSLLTVSAVTAAYSLSQLLKKGGGVRPKMMKYTFRESLPHLPHTASSAVTGEADKFVITGALGAVALAKYSVVHSVSAGLTFVVSALGSALTPWVLRHSGKGDGKRVSEVLALVFRILGMLTLFLLAIIPEAVKFLAPPEYSEAIGAAFPIALSTLPSFLTSISTVGITHSEKSRYTVIISVTAAILNILLNFMLIPIFGYLGAGLALLLSQSAGATLALFYLRKCGKSYFSDTRELAATLSVTLFFGILISLCKDAPALRPLLLTVPAIITLNSLFVVKKYVMEA